MEQKDTGQRPAAMRGVANRFRGMVSAPDMELLNNAVPRDAPIKRFGVGVGSVEYMVQRTLTEIV